MNWMRELIKKYPLICFFVFTYLFTWILFLPLLITEDEQTFGILGLIGLFGPALVHIFTSRQLSSEKTRRDRKKQLILFLAIWIVATLAFSLNVWFNSGIESPFAVAIFAIISLIPAFVFASSYSKFKQLRKGLISLVKPKGNILLFAFAFLFAPIVKLIGIPLSNLMELAPLSSPEYPEEPMQLLIFIAVAFFWGFFFAGGLNEEVGWSGFALPQLQKKFNPIYATIILWFFWILWHIPFQFGGFWNAESDDFIRALIGSFFARFILTWLFIKTRGGLLPVMILHVSANVSFMVLPATYPSMILEAVIAIFLIAKFNMFRKLPERDPAVYQLSG